jgi:serine/threonine-protein kinase
VVHRDVKPQNIVVTGSGEVKIMDFGIARVADVKGLTGTGLILGTPDYLSPEQAQGSQDLDHRSDIYSMGVVLHEVFSGQLPFEAETAVAVVLQHVQQPPPRLREVRPDLPEALEAIVLRCLEKEPARRYPTMQMLHDQLVNVSVRAA